MLKLKQRNKKIKDKNIAYVETYIVLDGKAYRVLFDERTKKSINEYYRTLGFEIGVLGDNEIVQECEIEF